MITKMTGARRLIYGVLGAAIVAAIAAKCWHSYRVSEYRHGREQLEKMLQKDEQFRSARIVFYSTRPSVTVLASRSTSASARQELEKMIITAFGPLPVTIEYGDPSFFENGTGTHESNEFLKTNAVH
jgi:hypothetical protein